ncbi:hypothetical protein V2W30_20140 [Streptomyces sp. Q6]|uniref:Uncharacterized protein n=1 Tax=Streptomyces citrinus TaxID=3118173 RepID=A0ACD5AE92_9ACTN
MTCGLDVDGWGWINFNGRGLLMHDIDGESVPCPHARPIDWATGDELPPIAPATLTATEWITSLYLSDYVAKSRPTVAALAVLITQGLNRSGFPQVAEKAAQLREFWEHCENDTDTCAVWDTYNQRFDRTRAFQSSYEIERNWRALNREFAATAAEEVAA